jgi:tricorn protease-like protein/regulation of enolase protein 1 (concanavalin A-like superfamily)
MHRYRAFAALALIPFCFLALSAPGQSNAAPLGLFEADQDIGSVAHAGKVEYNLARQTYLISGGGSNMWFTSDAFHFLWKKMSDDFTLAADVSFIGTEGDPHRKACLIVRQNLDADSPYADAALHGSGLVALQYRETNGAVSREIQSTFTNTTRIRLEKRGRNVWMSIAAAGEALHPAGGAFQLALNEPFYVGLGVCAHNNNDLRQAIFSNVVLNAEPPASGKATLASTLETIVVASKDRTAVFFTPNHIEAPNWSRDGAWLMFNGGGHLYRLPLAGGEPTQIDTGFANHCNNDHGFSPDGTQVAISDQSQGKDSLIYLVPVTGGVPKQITKCGPSYWHGWSPDGKTLAYCGVRGGEYDIYTIPASGGEETRLTTAPGLDDGPEYSPDGKFIYFSSERSGSMQIWRMAPDGSNPEQVTSDEYNNWFPHLSPNGRWLAFLSYEKDVKGHPGNKDATLRMMPVAGGKIEVFAKLFGGQGTLNVGSWSPDSTKLAFMSYQLMP